MNAVRKHFVAAFEAYTKLVFDQKTSDLSESQPTKGNIAGGLTTIEENRHEQMADCQALHLLAWSWRARSIVPMEKLV